MDQAEKLRRMVNQQHERVPTSRVIAITSGKGGVGKSSITVNLALQLKKQGKRVVIIDSDFGLANVEVMLGVRPKYNISDLIYNGKSIQDIITMGPNNIGFISGGSGVSELADIQKEQLKLLISQLVVLDAIADVILIDTGAGIADMVLELLLASPEVILVVTPEPTSITDAYALLKALNRRPEFEPSNKSIKFLANRVPNLSGGTELYNKLDVVVSKFLDIKMEYLGAIPQDDNMVKAIVAQSPASISFPASQCSKAFTKTAMQLENKQLEDGESKAGIARVFMSLFKSKR